MTISKGMPGAAAWRRLRDWLRPPPVAEAAAFRDFLGGQAAFIAQKCAYDYCRGKAGVQSYALFEEEAFMEAFSVCRWESLAAVLADVLIVAEGWCRHRLDPDAAERVGEALLDFYGQILASHPLPPHRPQGWGDCIASFETRFRAVQAAEPLPPADVAEASARRMFETLPIHSSMRRFDEEIVQGAVRFRMIGFVAAMDERLRLPEIVADLHRRSVAA